MQSHVLPRPDACREGPEGTKLPAAWRCPLPSALLTAAWKWQLQRGWSSLPSVKAPLAQAACEGQENLVSSFSPASDPGPRESLS